jgi:hypothetical protein
MIRFFSLFILLIFSNNLFAKNTIAELDIDGILKLVNKKEVHRALLQLKKSNSKFNQGLLKEKSYKPDQYTFSNVLELILDKIPNNLTYISSCNELKEAMMSDYKVKWEDLDQPTHKIWPAIQLICKK